MASSTTPMIGLFLLGGLLSATELWAQDDAPDDLALPPLLEDPADEADPEDRGERDVGADAAGPLLGDAPPPPAEEHQPTDPASPAPLRGDALDAQIGRLAGPSVVRLRARLEDGRLRQATGVFVGPREVATTYTALRGARSASIDLGGDPRPFTVEGVIAIDPNLDLAVVRLREAQVGSRPIARSSRSPRRTDPAWVVAFPKANEGSRPTVFPGQIAAVRPRRAEGLEGDHRLPPGVAGGALVDGDGALLGLVLPLRSRQGAALAVQTRRLETLLKHRHPPVPLRRLERFLEDRSSAEVYADAYDLDEGYASDDAYADLDQGRGPAAERQEGDSREQVAWLLAALFVGPPIALGVGMAAAGLSVCVVYGCLIGGLLVTAPLRFAVAGLAAGVLIGGMASAVALTAGWAAAVPLAGGAPLAGSAALATSLGAGALATAAGVGSAVAAGAVLALLWARREDELETAPEEAPPADERARSPRLEY